jgi:hypothetical protein
MEATMVTLDECIGMSGLTDDEITVIAEHRRMPSIVAVEVGHALLETAKGKHILRGYMSELLEKARVAGKRDRAQHLERVLIAFNRRHPTPPALRR